MKLEYQEGAGNCQVPTRDWVSTRHGGRSTGGGIIGIMFLLGVDHTPAFDVYPIAQLL